MLNGGSSGESSPGVSLWETGGVGSLGCRRMLRMILFEGVDEGKAGGDWEG